MIVFELCENFRQMFRALRRRCVRETEQIVLQPNNAARHSRTVRMILKWKKKKRTAESRSVHIFDFFFVHKMILYEKTKFADVETRHAR